VGQKLADRWGQSVIIDNRPGGGQVIGTDIVAKAPADGYTLLMCTQTFSVNPSLFETLPYDPLRDFQPVSLVARAPLALFVNPTLPAKTLKELIALAKARPGQINFASSGPSSSLRFAGELLKSMTGIEIVHVPYKGSGPALTDLISGQVQMMFNDIIAALPHVKSGRIRVLATASDKRSAAMPEVPTMAEAGLPGYVAESWFGVLAPAKVPREVVAALNGEIVRILDQPEVRARIVHDGGEPVSSTPAQFNALIRSEMQKWGKIIRDNKIRPD
jgi:tripartite-type tricarboxylate transporter receptor subunit TctC